MAQWRNSTAFALMATALAAAGCASAHAPPASSLLADARPDRGARCSVAPDPAVLPRPEALVDAGFRADAERLWVQAGRPAGHVLFSVRHAADGTQVRRAVLESTVPEALADSLQALVFAHRQQAAPERAEWGVRLRVDLGDPVALAVGRRQECAPRPREEERLSADPYDVRERGLSAASLPTTDASLVWVRVRLDARGYVTDAIVERGIRRGVWEQRLLNYVRTMAFYPAVEDGFPVPSELTIPLRPTML